MHPVDRLLRYPSADALAKDAAARLVGRILALQDGQPVVHLCLSTTVLGSELQAALARCPRIGDIDATRLHLWWAAESFVDATDPNRSSTHTLSQLHSALPLLAAHAHTMPQRSGYADPDAAAYAYAQEIGSTVFDLCLLGLGEDGHLAGIYPHHPSLEAAQDPQALVIGVTDAPWETPDQMSLSFGALNSTAQVWVFALGDSRRAMLAASLAQAPELPAAYLRPREGVLWFADEAAAADLPTFECSL